MRRRRRTTRTLREAVDALPRRTREAMLRGVEMNRIVVGAYVDPRSGGICPMLAAHRNGGRTSVAGFARAWDDYTGARRPRRATSREVRTLRALLEQSLDLDPAIEHASIAELADQVRAEREQLAASRRGDRDHACRPGAAPLADLDLLAATEVALAEQGAWARGGAPEPARAT